MRVANKRILLYLGKFPGYGFDIDGGSILASQLIDTLKKRAILDVVFIRKNKEVLIDPEINSIRYVEYIDAFNNKFVRRLKNLTTNQIAIGDYTHYDIIITAHISKFFGMEAAPSDFWDKTVLFPMFLTPSYKRAGEQVPTVYTEHERDVLKKVRKIITPSFAEKYDLIDYYGIDSNKISVIYRGINPAFVPATKIFTPSLIKIAYIGSIKIQKNPISALSVLSKIIDAGKNAELHYIGTIQDSLLYEQLLHYIECNNLSTNVHFHIEVSQQSIADLLKNMDINISVSNWETFGRGIFEGIAAGLPTFVPSHLKCIRDICKDNIGVVFCDSDTMMALEIIKLIDQPEEYPIRKASLLHIAEQVSFYTERRKLIAEILE